MSSQDMVMFIDKPNFSVKLHSSFIEFDLKEGVRKKLEDILEANPTVRRDIGFFFQSLIPLDVPLRNVKAVKQSEKGQVRIAIPHRRDITIQLEPDEAKELVNKLNELIPIEKQKEAERLLAVQETLRKRALARTRKH